MARIASIDQRPIQHANEEEQKSLHGADRGYLRGRFRGKANIAIVCLEDAERIQQAPTHKISCLCWSSEEFMFTVGHIPSRRLG